MRPLMQLAANGCFDPKETDAGSYTNSRFPQTVLSPLWRDVKGLRLPNSGLYRYSTTYTQRERVGASSDDYRNGASYCAMNCLLFISPRRSCYGSVKSQWSQWALNRYVKFVLHALAAGKWCHRIKLGAALPQKNRSFMQALIQP